MVMIIITMIARMLNSPAQCESDDPNVLGVIHVMASQSADLDDVQIRVSRYLEARKMDVVVQVEREGEGRCWCGGGMKSC